MWVVFYFEKPPKLTYVSPYVFPYSENHQLYWVCVSVSVRTYFSEDMLAGPLHFRGLLGGSDLVLRIRLESGLGAGDCMSMRVLTTVERLCVCVLNLQRANQQINQPAFNM